MYVALNVGAWLFKKSIAGEKFSLCIIMLVIGTCRRNSLLPDKVMKIVDQLPTESFKIGRRMLRLNLRSFSRHRSHRPRLSNSFFSLSDAACAVRVYDLLL